MNNEPIPIESFWCRQHHLVSQQLEHAELVVAELRRRQANVALIIDNIRKTAKGEQS